MQPIENIAKFYALLLRKRCWDQIGEPVLESNTTALEHDKGSKPHWRTFSTLLKVAYATGLIVPEDRRG